MSELAERRKRGRPRKEARSGASARAAILKAAAEEFAERGYEAASLRAIARRAGVDSALVHHYFDDKADLFTASLEAPLRPDRALEVILAGPHDEIGVSIVRFLLEQLENPKAQARMVAILRTALSSGPGSRMLREFLTREVFLRLATAAGGDDDARLRANLAAAQLVGVMITRFVLKLEPIATAPAEDLARRVGPVIQWHLFGDPSQPLA
ncbi:TetR/AcrR family transcriptional regulator [Leifsonia poae]|uniref:TetR family transcriptional regulator n=1 Tax=Leifsonia poae TaxID=110933 RepID=A0A9W6H6G9_9MICO|nr:TetR family transcriptional regulator [Leifsonia poae]GLJ74527.1 TetR family transcriptional regulator [Leifsonia poae]